MNKKYSVIAIIAALAALAACAPVVNAGGGKPAAVEPQQPQQQPQITVTGSGMVTR